MKTKIAQSFSEEEVALLSQLLETLLRGGDVRILMKSPMFGRLQRKARRMQERVQEAKADQES
jgi:cytidylate kinase